MTQQALRQLAVFSVGAFLIGLLTLAPAQASEPNTKPLKASAKSLTAVPGSSGELELQLDLAEPYRAYLDQFKLRVLDNPTVSVSSLDISPVIRFFDTFSKKEKEGIKGSGQIKTRLSFPPDFPTVQTELQLELTYQACTDEHCLFPTKLMVPVAVEIKSGPALQSSGSSAPKSSDQGILSFESALGKGLLYTFLFVFLAGILTSFTPCIFPMIPITLSIIGASQIRHMPGSETAINKRSRWRGFSISVVYVLGIALTYALLGVLAAKTGALFGAALSSPWVVSAIVLVFVAMGLSMYGLFEIQMPSFLRDSLSKTKTDPGYVGAFVAGLIAGIVASPCVGPVLVGLLTHVAKTQDVVLGFSLLFTFAIGMGLLLIAIGTFSSLTSKLPRSGPWMDGVKFVFGTAMIGMALFYLEPILPDSAFFLIFGLTAILISSAFGAFGSNSELKTVPQKIWKGLMLAGFVVGLLYMIKGLMFQTPFVLPSAQLPNSNLGSSNSSSIWKKFDDTAFEKALTEGKPIVVDFWADWCAACKELDKFTFSDLSVQADLAKFETFKVDMTSDNEATTELRKKFGIVGLPTVAIFVGGQERADLRLTGFESAGDFRARLKNALNLKN